MSALSVPPLLDLSREVQESLTAQPSVLEGFADMVGRYGYQAYVTREGLTSAYAVLSDHVWTYVGCWPDHRSVWEHPACDESAQDRMAQRLDILEHLRAASTYLTRPLSEVLLTPCNDDRTTRRAELQVALAWWWDNRQDEGCDPETARMLLGLTVPAVTWRRLRFEGDKPPVYGTSDRPSGRVLVKT